MKLIKVSASVLATMVAMSTMCGVPMLVAAQANASGNATDDPMPPLDVPADAKPGPGDRDFKGGRGGFRTRGGGGRMMLCPTGDCKDSVIDVTLARLVELGSDGKPTKNRAAAFASVTYNWTAPTTSVQNGVNVTSSGFNASLVLSGSAKPVTFRSSVDFYASNATKEFAGTVIEIPAGGLKFAVWVEDWPFLSESNTLQLGLRVMARNKKGDKKPKGGEGQRRGKDKKIDRVELLDGAFLDSPAVAELDGVAKNITYKMAADKDFVLLDYAFPSFKKTLYYDPVIGSSDTPAASGGAVGDSGSKSGNVRSAAGTPMGAGAAALVCGTLAVAAVVVRE